MMTIAPGLSTPGGGAPLTSPFFHGVSPRLWTLAAHEAPGYDSLRGRRLDTSASSSRAKRASSGGAQLLKIAMQVGGNLDGAGGGCAGARVTCILMIVLASEDRSFSV